MKILPVNENFGACDLIPLGMSSSKVANSGMMESEASMTASRRKSMTEHPTGSMVPNILPIFPSTFRTTASDRRNASLASE